MQTSWKFRFDRDAVVFLLASGLLAVGGVAAGWDTYCLDQRGVVVDATVVGERTGKKARIDVRYVTRGGETIEKRVANLRAAEVGDDIQVLYDPQNPRRMQPTDWGLSYNRVALWFAGAIGFGAAGVLCAFGFLADQRAWLRTRRRSGIL